MTTFLRITLPLFALTACTVGEDPETPEDGAMLRWDLQGLEPLAEGSVYEGWVVVDGAPVSTGRFNIDSNGVAELDHFELTADQVAGATTFVLSIEPEMGDVPEPSETKLLGGELDAEGSADLALAHPAALGDDLTTAMAPFILETPTSADPDDYSQGIWWLDPAAGPGASATLPALPAGWVYEGWVVTDGPISTGRFSTASGADSDGGGPEAGPDGAPPFPGSDFIDPALDLVGATVVISIEPVPDDSPAPFVLKPLVLGGVTDVGPGVLIDMTNQAATNNPTGSVWME